MIGLTIGIVLTCSLCVCAFGQQLPSKQDQQFLATSLENMTKLTKQSGVHLRYELAVKGRDVSEGLDYTGAVEVFYSEDVLAMQSPQVTSVQGEALSVSLANEDKEIVLRNVNGKTFESSIAFLKSSLFELNPEDFFIVERRDWEDDEGIAMRSYLLQLSSAKKNAGNTHGGVNSIRYDINVTDSSIAAVEFGYPLDNRIRSMSWSDLTISLSENLPDSIPDLLTQVVDTDGIVTETYASWKLLDLRNSK